MTELRPAQAGDYDEIAAIWHASASLPGVGPPTMPSQRELRGRIDTEIAKGWSVTLATEPCGMRGFLATKPVERVLDQLFVVPQAIGSGIGRSLFAHACREMPAGFVLHTATTNRIARAFYERGGMVLTHETAHPRTGHPVVWYEWKPDQ